MKTHQQIQLILKHPDYFKVSTEVWVQEEIFSKETEVDI